MAQKRYDTTLDFCPSDSEQDEFIEKITSGARRNLLAEIQRGIDIKDGMDIYLRCRPFIQNETQEEKDCITIEDLHTVKLTAPKQSVTAKNAQSVSSRMEHRFHFTKIFNEKTTQSELYDGTISDQVDSFLEGENVLLLAYGVTNSGKSYTIHGESNTEEARGLLPRSIQSVFDFVGESNKGFPKFKPRLFADVINLSEEQIRIEQEIKDQIMKMAVPVMTRCSSTASNDSNATSLWNSMSSTNLSDVDTADYTTASDYSQDSLNAPAAATLGTHNSQSIPQSKQTHVTITSSKNDVNSDCTKEQEFRYAVWVSFAEIYKEVIYDLLSEAKITS